MTRTTVRMFVFARPFVLAGIDGIQPAGQYAVEIDEEEIPNLSFTAYRRVETRITVPWIAIGTRGNQTVAVRLEDIEAAMAADAAGIA